MHDYKTAQRRRWALFVLLAAISAVLAFFSSALLLPVAVFTWGSKVTFVLLWLGWLLGGIGTHHKAPKTAYHSIDIDREGLVTLLGMGGLGKTRLSLQVAAEQMAQNL